MRAAPQAALSKRSAWCSLSPPVTTSCPFLMQVVAVLLSLALLMVATMPGRCLLEAWVLLI